MEEMVQYIHHGEQSRTIDARGLGCPHPVILTKKAVEKMKEGKIVVIVDNSTACENVSRYASSQGCQVKVEKKGEDYYVEIGKE